MRRRRDVGERVDCSLADANSTNTHTQIYMVQHGVRMVTRVLTTRRIGTNHIEFAIYQQALTIFVVNTTYTYTTHIYTYIHICTYRRPMLSNNLYSTTSAHSGAQSPPATRRSAQSTTSRCSLILPYIYCILVLFLVFLVLIIILNRFTSCICSLCSFNFVCTSSASTAYNNNNIIIIIIINQ